MAAEDMAGVIPNASPWVNTAVEGPRDEAWNQNWKIGVMSQVLFWILRLVQADQTSRDSVQSTCFCRAALTWPVVHVNAVGYALATDLAH